MDADDKVLDAPASLGQTEAIEEETYQVLEEYICFVYLCAPKFKTLKELWWWCFTKKQVDNVSMPPPQAALRPAIRRAHYQAIIWQQAQVPKPNLLPVTDFGWALSAKWLLHVSDVWSPFWAWRSAQYSVVFLWSIKMHTTLQVCKEWTVMYWNVFMLSQYWKVRQYYRSWWNS